MFGKAHSGRGEPPTNRRQDDDYDPKLGVLRSDLDDALVIVPPPGGRKPGTVRSLS